MRVKTLPNPSPFTQAEPTTAPRERMLEELAENAAPRGFRIAYDLLGSRAEAEDAVQEALARACESWQQIRDPGAAEAWFRRVLVNVCMRTLRRRKFRRVLRGLVPGAGEPPTDAVAEDLPHPAREPGADDQLSFHGMTRDLMVALEHLPAKQRTALILRYGQEMSVGEVADLLDVGHGTAKTHLVRGLKGLRVLMEKNR